MSATPLTTTRNRNEKISLEDRVKTLEDQIKKIMREVAFIYAKVELRRLRKDRRQFKGKPNKAK
jgi:ABC-type phosphate transport system auxiliary subunit